jgi:hypothetical protein
MINFSQQPGVRIILPVLPLILYYAYTATKVIIPNVIHIQGRILAISLTVIVLFPGYHEFGKAFVYKSENAIPMANDFKAFQYIRDSIANNEVIIFAKPRALTLFTNKKCMVAAPYASIDENTASFERVNAKYMLINATIGDSFYYRYSRYIHIDSTEKTIADGYTLYRLR